MRLTSPARGSNALAAMSCLVIATALSLAAAARAEPENTTGFRAGAANVGERAGLADREARSPELQAEIEAQVLPEVRLTPPVATVAGLDDFRQSLNGTWHYRNRMPDDFDGTIAGGEPWSSFDVPGSPAANGYEPMEREFGEPVGWARTFEVPAAWQGRRVVLRFDTLDGLSRVYLNGREIGSTEQAFLPAEFDLTDALVDGENELVVTLERSYFTHWHNRELGGMGRDVYLLALPQANIGRFHVQTTFDERFEDATVEVLAAVANQSDEVLSGAELAFALDGSTLHREPLPDVPAGETHRLTMRVPVERPRHWHPETPNLYDATLTLSAGGEDIMTAVRRMGFVQIENRDGTLTVNGKPFKIKGNNYHTTYLGHDHAPPPQVLRDDVKLFVETNHSALRPWPTPGEAYMEACDELGLFTTIEVPILAMMYSDGPLKDKGDNRLMTEPYQRLAATVLETYRSHPSVLTWGLANECPYYEYFERAAYGIAREDPTRTVFFGSDNRVGIDRPGLSFNDDHYPRFGMTGANDAAIVGGDWEQFPSDKPIMFTEWLHVHWNNWSERAFDPGIFEYWGHHARAHVAETYNHPHVAGGMIFGSTPLRGVFRDFDFGHWDLWRHPNDTAWIVKKAYSPVPLLDTIRRPKSVQFVVANRHATLNLADCAIAWSRGDERGEARTSLPPGETGEITVPLPTDAREPIRVTITDPRGVVLDEHEWQPEPTPAEPAALDAGPLVLEENSDMVTIANDRVAFEIDMTTGQLVAGRVDGATVLTGGPHPVVRRSGDGGWPRNSEPVVNTLANWRAGSVEWKGNALAVAGSFDEADAVYVVTFGRDGEVDVEWQLVWKSDQTVDVFQLGVAFDVAEGFDTIAWQRDADRAMWTAYPDDHIGRLSGVATRYGDPATLERRRAWTKNGRADWPWSQDLIEGVEGDGLVSTRDFRATKFGVMAAALTDANGHALAIDGVANVQVTPTNDGFSVQLGDFHNGGTEFHLIKSIRRDVLLTKPGLVLSGEASLRLTPAD